MVKIILLLSIVILGVFFSETKSFHSLDVRKRIYITLVTIVLILQSGLRNWAIGSDTYQYYYIFDMVRHESWKSLIDNFTNYEGKDPFYRIFLKVFQVFSNSYQMYLMLVAVIFMTALGNFIYKNTSQIRHAMLAFVVYMGYFYGFFSITGIRQTIATAVLLWSFEYVKNKKYLPYIILVSIASLFHVSALVFLLVGLIVNFKKPQLLFTLTLISFPLVFVFKNNLAIFFVESVGMDERFGAFTEQYFRGGSFILTLLHVLLGAIGLFLYKKVIKINPSNFRLYNMFALALFFFPLQWVNPSAGRIAMYFDIIIMVLIPYLLDAFAGKNIIERRLLYSLTIVLFIILITFTITSWDEYKFFWQYMPIPY